MRISAVFDIKMAYARLLLLALLSASLATASREIKLMLRSSLHYSPSLTVSELTRTVSSRLVCSSLCVINGPMQPKCLAVTYMRLNGSCTVYFNPPESAPDSSVSASGIVSPGTRALSSLVSDSSLEVWSYNDGTAGAGSGGSTLVATTTVRPTLVSTTFFLNFTSETPSNTGSVRLTTLPYDGCYRAEAIGAAGGACASSGSIYPGGLGASVRGDFILSSGQRVALVPASPGTNATSEGGTHGGGGGGGGGSFIWLPDSVPIRLLVAAGGGGGASNLKGGHNATGSSNGSNSISVLINVEGAGGVDGQPGAAGDRLEAGKTRGGPGAGWLASAALGSALIAGDGPVGLSRGDTNSWQGGGPDGFPGGFGGGGAGATRGSAGGGGGYSGGGSGGAYADAGGAGGSLCAVEGKNCLVIAGSSLVGGGGGASLVYLGKACP